MNISEPSCPYGYTHLDLETLFPTEEAHKAFYKWMTGQTVAICDGHEYNHDTRQYVETVCRSAPHGTVVYPWDLKRYLEGGKIID